MANSLLLILQLLCIFSSTCTAHIPKFPAIFAFGDSLLDSGNNNFILTLFQANHPPYGQSFPNQVPTGRFSNGKLVSDFLAFSLGIKDTIPPFLDPNLPVSELKTGVSFASADFGFKGAGFDDLTNVKTQGIPIFTQVENFKKYIEILKGVVGEKEALDIIKDALVLIMAGSNDIALSLNNGFLRRLDLGLSGYHSFLHQRLEEIIKRLYDNGCRNVLITGLPPLGCIPAQMTARSSFNRQCIQNLNSEAQSYNQKLTEILPRIQGTFPGSKLVYADLYQPLIDMNTNPQKYGYLEVGRGCCGTGLFEVGWLCNHLTPICSNASQFLYFDAIHPTELAYHSISDYFMTTAIPLFLE
ncbi:GDSL esterase/lipase At2g31550-like [Nicotiana tabacum]|uniref:GDSL esterase/lipase At2g31550-like n=1 Tax=Nicotiana tabacum TaxID=4097 RepID=A0AC58TNI3_TOBAC